MRGGVTLIRLLLVCAGLAVLVYCGAVLTVPGQWLDDEVFGCAQRLAPGPARDALPTVARTVLPPVSGAAAVAALVLGVLRRRWPQALAALAVVAISVPLARWLRLSLPRPDHGYSYVENTLPSTHVAWVTSCVVVVLLLWPRPPSLSLFLGAALVVWISCIGNVVGYAHRPSDAVASVLLVLAVAAGVATVAGLLGRRAPDTLPR